MHKRSKVQPPRRQVRQDRKERGGSSSGNSFSVSCLYFSTSELGVLGVLAVKSLSSSQVRQEFHEVAKFVLAELLVEVVGHGRWSPLALLDVGLGDLDQIAVDGHQPD